MFDIIDIHDRALARPAGSEVSPYKSQREKLYYPFGEAW